MSLADLYMLGRQAVALADNGHTRMNLRDVRTEFNSVGVRYYNFQDGLYVVRALAEHQQLIGGRVVEIDGQPIDGIFAVLNAYTGGPAGWRQMISMILLESPYLLNAAGLSISPGGYTLTLEDQSGDTLQTELSARLPQDRENISYPITTQTLDAGARPDEGNAWVRTLQGFLAEDLPLYVQQTDQLFMWTPLQDGGGYIRLQEMRNAQGSIHGIVF